MQHCSFRICGNCPNLITGEDRQEFIMCYIAPRKSALKAIAVSSNDEFEAYYSAEPTPQPVKPSPELSALDLMYAYYDAA